MKALYYYLGISCLLLTGCVSEQWVRGYVQHELAGVKDTVAEEVYPTEKALTDIKTQMATITVEQKRIADELQAMKATAPPEDKELAELSQMEKALTDIKTQMATITVEQKRIADELQATKATAPPEDKELAELSQKVAELAFDLRNMLEGLVKDLLNPHPELINVQTGTETTGKVLNPTSGGPGTTTEILTKTLMEESKVMDEGRER